MAGKFDGFDSAGLIELVEVFRRHGREHGSGSLTALATHKGLVAPDRVRSDVDYGFLLSENRDIILSTALMFHTNLDLVPGLTIDVGPQGYLALLAAVKKTDVFAVALGADARYLLPFLSPRWGIAAFGGAFYSPGVLTFGSAHNLYDFTAGVEVQFTPRLAGLAGYRWLKFTTVNEPDVRVQNEVFAGLRWRLH